MDSISSLCVRNAGEKREQAARGPGDVTLGLDDPLVSVILCSLPAFGRGVSQLAAQWDSADTAEGQQGSPAYTASTADAVDLFDDFCLASSVTNAGLSRLQLPLLYDLAPITAPFRPDGAEGPGPPLHFPPEDTACFLAALRKLQEHLLHLTSHASTHDQHERGITPTLLRRCPFHNRAAQEDRRQRHAEPRLGRQEAQRQTLMALARVFHLFCRVRCSSILYSCFLLLASCSSGCRDDPFLRFLASVWLLCDEADAALKTVDPTDPTQWQMSAASAKSASADFSAGDPTLFANKERSDISFSAEGEPKGTLSAEVPGHRGGKVKGSGYALRRLLSGASLSRAGSKPSLAAAKQSTHSPEEQPEFGHCLLLAASRCQCVAYVRGFIASLLPTLLWTYLTRILLPLNAQPLPHLLFFMLEEAEQGGPVREPEKGAMQSHFHRLRERFLQQEDREGGQLVDNSSGLEDLLLLVAGSAEGIPLRKKEKRSFGAAVAASMMLPQSLHLDGRQGAETPEANSLLQMLATFAGGSRCTSLLAGQQQRSLQLRAMIGHSTAQMEASKDRYLEEGGTQLLAASEGEADAPKRCREHLLLQRPPPPLASFMTTDGIQDLAVRVLACFSCYSNACCTLEGSVATAAGSAEGAYAFERGIPQHTMAGGPLLAAGWAQCALWAQQQLLMGADDHTALLAAGLSEAMTSPHGFVPLTFGSLMPQELLLLARRQQEQDQPYSKAVMGSSDGMDALATQLVDRALLPLDCSCGGSIRDDEVASSRHCLNAAVASKSSIELLLHLEVDPSKTGKARLAVGEALMLQVCKTLGALLHAVRPEGSTRIPSWSIPLGGIECPANAPQQADDQWLEELHKAAASAVQQVQRLFQQAKAAAGTNADGRNAAKQQMHQTKKRGTAQYGCEPFPHEALQHQLRLLLMLHQTQHFSCNCCCCSFTDSMGCSTIGYLVHLNAASYRRTCEMDDEGRPKVPTSIFRLWPLFRQTLLMRRLQSAARRCTLKAERDWLPQSYWAFVALGTLA